MDLVDISVFGIQKKCFQKILCIPGIPPLILIAAHLSLPPDSRRNGLYKENTLTEK